MNLSMNPLEALQNLVYLGFRKLQLFSLVAALHDAVSCFGIKAQELFKELTV